MTPEIKALVEWYESLSRDSLATISNYYTSDCYFKDPFNEVRSRNVITSIFIEMFEKLDSPHFIIDEVICDENKAFMTWRFNFSWRGKSMVINGGSHLRISSDGLVNYHRDYWDAAEELYEKIPVLGWFLRRIKNMAKA